MAALTNLGMRIQETFSESTRDMAFIGRSRNVEFFDTGEDKVRKIRRQLDGSSEREILEGMKRLVALISKGRNVSEFFAQVVKNVGSPNLEIRKLVYIYLLRYADSEPDLALLSINTFQKDLSDSNPLIRAMALRVLSGIRVSMIASIVVIGIKKCASDLSPYVRKAAALAIPKVYGLDPSQLSSLMPILVSLLRDRSPLSIGAVAVAFDAVCPTRLDLLHQQYRRLCRILSDADEWGQVHLIDLLTRYARTMLPAPSETSGYLDSDLKLLLDSVEPLFQSRNPAVTMAVVRVFYYLGPPSQRVKAIAPLLSLMHRSPEIERVVLGNCLVIARDHPTLLHRYLSRFIVRADDLPPTKRVKVKILSKLVTTGNFETIISEFKDYTFDMDDDLVADSIQAIGRCARVIPEALEHCLSILMRLIRSTHEATVTNTILVLKYLYQYRLLTPSGLPTAPSTSRIVADLARRLDTIQHPAARACIIWLVGQYCPAETGDVLPTVVPGIADWAPDVLRTVAKSFPTESDPVRLQILTLAAKFFVVSPSTTVIQLLARHVFTQARFDVNYDVQDRGRMLCALLRGIPGAQDLDGAAEADRIGGEAGVDEDAWERRTKEKEANMGGVILRVEQARAILFEGKGAVDDGEEVISPGLETLGTIGIVMGKTIYGDFARRFFDWSEGTDPLLRDSPADVPPQAPQLPQAFGSGGAARVASAAPIVLTPTTTATTTTATTTTSAAGNGKNWRDLDEFYASEESDEGDSGSEDDEEEDEGSGESSSEDEG